MTNEIEPKIFQEGNVRELWRISMPLMISVLASLLMIFVDRCFLARYSLDALNASVNAGTLAWACIGGVGMLTAMSEIFVSQYNGSQNIEKIGIPVWQNIWLALFSIAFFIPMGLWIGPLFFSGTIYEKMQTDYFSILMIFGPSYALMMAISGFYIGRGKTTFLIWLAVTANLINVILDWILIFGIEGVVPEMGIKGAAIATCFGNVFQTAVLTILFFKKSHRQKYGTRFWKIHLPTLAKCCRVGFPQAIFYSLEILGWAIFYQMMTSISEIHITVSSICQSFIILLSFFMDGLYRGVAAAAGNFIGARNYQKVKNVLKSAVVMQIVFSAVIGTVLILDPNLTVNILFPGNFEELSPFLTLDPSMSIYNILRICLACVFLYLSFEGVRWIFAGLLSAAGDTFFLLVAGSISVWIFLLLPVYLVVVQNKLTVEIAWALAVVYSLLSCSIYWVRFQKGKWKEINLIPVETKEIHDKLPEN